MNFHRGWSGNLPIASPAASAVETLNPAKEESEISAPAPAARRSAWRREMPSNALLMPEGRLILFIRAKSTPDCRIRKYYRSLIQKLTNGRRSLVWSISLTAQLKNASVIQTGNGELPVRLIAPSCLSQYDKAGEELFSSFFANTCWLGGKRGRRIGTTLGWPYAFFGPV